jgi:uncharacterized protein
VDEVISHFQWMSVIVTGRYQEFPNTPALNFERQHALTALGKRMLWWQTAIAAKQLPTGHEVPEPLFYRIHIESMTGLRAFPDAVEARTSLANQTRTL